MFEILYQNLENLFEKFSINVELLTKVRTIESYEVIKKNISIIESLILTEHEKMF